MKVDELKDEEMYCLCAPDGSIQVSTLAPDFAMCIGMCELLASANISESLAVLFKKGFSIMPVNVTITQNGDEEKAFQDFKKTLKTTHNGKK